MQIVTKLCFDWLAEDYANAFLIEPHQHDAHQIVHAVSGIMRVSTDDGVWIVPPGRALWMPEARVHAIKCIGPVEMRTVYIHGTHAAFPDRCAAWSVTPLMREIIVRMSNGAGSGMLEHLSALLLDEIDARDVTRLRLPQPKDQRLARICDALIADSTRGPTLGEWAKRIGMSERSLIAHFKAETGLTFREWRRQARMLRGLELLSQGLDVTSTAFEVGYASTSAFVEAFRLTFGTTPSRHFT